MQIKALLSESHQEFIADLKSKKRATATILAYSKDTKQLIDYLASVNKKQCDEARTKDIENFMADLSKKNYTNKSISRKTNSTKTFFKFLKSKGYITDDPAAPVTHPKYETKPPRVLSKMEYRALRDVCRNDIRISAIVELLLQTGIRIGELANLKLEDLSDTHLNIKPYESHASRSIPLNKTAQKSLKRYLKIRQKTPEKTVFVTKTGRPLLIRNIRTAIDRYFRLTGIKNAKVNDLRHTWITHQLASGASLLLVSKLAGHKRLSTTEKYLDLVQDKVEEKVKLEEL
jgi:site-specific recombinase XerD